MAIRIAVLAAAGMLAAARADAMMITLNLDSLAPGPFTSALAVDGFYLTPVLGGSSTPAIVTVGGTNTLQSSANSAAGADTYLTRIDGGTFTLVSIEVAALNGDNGHYGIGVSDTIDGAGYYYGTYGCAQLQPNQVCGTLTSSFVTQSYGSTFADVTWIDLDPVNGGDGEAIRSITVSYSPVPEPVSLAVLGSGLAGLVVVRRRRLRPGA